MIWNRAFHHAMTHLGCKLSAFLQAVNNTEAEYCFTFPDIGCNDIKEHDESAVLTIQG